MYGLFDAETRRQRAYDEYVGMSLEVIQRSEVTDALGDDADRLGDDLRHSFLVRREVGNLAMPADEVDSDNIGILPVVRRDAPQLAVRGPEWMHALDRDEVARHDPGLLVELGLPDTERHERSIEARRKANKFAAMVVEAETLLAIGDISSANGYRARFAYRPVVGLDAVYMRKESVLTRAALIYHELDHARRYHDISAAGKGRELVETLDEPARHVYFSTMLERPAYDISERILSTGDDGRSGTVDVLARRFGAMEPIEAGRRLTELVVRHKGVRESGLHLQAAGAVALSRVFGGDSPAPTREETQAYLAAGFVNPNILAPEHVDIAS